ncbi:MAG TPA: diaminopimelate decarboxylase [Bryobacteraceae bacterium]|nr:diaminopimelate decarboxylase [Bryobacteraceae bacterium]
MFLYSENSLYCEGVALDDIARRAGTPCYVYSRQSLLENFRAYDEALGDLPHMICYSVKANGSLGILSLLAKAGAGFDIVSGGELYRVLKAGGDPVRVVFSGVGKRSDEIDFALEKGIHSFNCESEPELALINALAARRGVRALFSLRVNPDVNAETHPYISTGLRKHKFGMDIHEAEPIYDRARELHNLEASGVSCHIGSQLLNASPIFEAMEKVLELVGRLRAAGHAIKSVDLGGGLGVAYQSTDHPPPIRTFVDCIRQRLQGMELTVMLEPGRSIVGPAGVLLTRVLYRKRNIDKEFVVVDAAMNDLIRPALYRSHHDILPLRMTARPDILADVVGPVCETGDFLARDRKLANVAPGDFLALATAGAYGFVQASNYNARRRPAEVLVEGDQWRIIRARETYEDLVRGETT